MVTMQYQAQSDMVELIERLERACIRFVHFSKENELRSRVFSEKMGLESGWNCHISLMSDHHRYELFFLNFIIGFLAGSWTMINGKYSVIYKIDLRPEKSLKKNKESLKKANIFLVLYYRFVNKVLAIFGPNFC